MTIHKQLEYQGLGRALYINNNGDMYRSHNYNIYHKRPEDIQWKKIVSIRSDFKGDIIKKNRLLSRLYRFEVRAFLPVGENKYVASTRTGIYYSDGENAVMKHSIVSEQSDKTIQFPMIISIGKDNRIIWGEYWGNRDRRDVRIFVSDDDGYSFQNVFTFKRREIRHIHNIIYDPKLSKYWVFTGDYGAEPGIGLLDDDFKKIEWVCKGQQKYRVVCAFDLGDLLVYATDTELEPNGIYILSKNTGKVEYVTEIDGSCIYGTRIGQYYVFSTTAEKLKYKLNNTQHQNSSIWVSQDAILWKKMFTAKKDIWPYKYFQYGSLVLPRGESRARTLLFSGQALKGIDGKVYTVQL